MTTTALTWPTVAELNATAESVGENESLGTLMYELQKLVDPEFSPSILDGVEPLTLETFGALSVAAAKLRLNLEAQINDVHYIECVLAALSIEVAS